MPRIFSTLRPSFEHRLRTSDARSVIDGDRSSGCESESQILSSPRVLNRAAERANVLVLVAVLVLVTGVSSMKLEVLDGGDGVDNDHATGGTRM